MHIIYNPNVIDIIDCNNITYNSLRRTDLALETFSGCMLVLLSKINYDDVSAWVYVDTNQESYFRKASEYEIVYFSNNISLCFHCFLSNA